MKNIILYTFMSIMAALPGKAQELKNIRVGQKVPDIIINNIINSNSKTQKLSSFGGKLLIIDFWATWCTPCIAAFPKLDSLSKKFPNDLRILSVTYEDKVQVADFVKKLYAVDKTAPVIATNDTTLKKLFFHTALPHYVWIDASMNVIAITRSDQLTVDNIRKVIAGQQAHLQMKKDTEKSLQHAGDDMGPVFTLTAKMKTGKEKFTEQIPDAGVKLYSSITGYLNGLGSGFINHSPTALFAYNNTIRYLYKLALLKASSSMLNSYKGAVVIDIQDPILYGKITAPDSVNKGVAFIGWLNENGYCYDLKVPSELSSKKFDVFLSDLNIYFGAKFGIEGVLEKRMQKYLALTWDNSNQSMFSSGGTTEEKIDKFSLELRNTSIASLVYQLRQPLQLHPMLIDETGYKGKIDISLLCNVSNLEEVNKGLLAYGLRLIEKEKEMDVPVIRMKRH